MAERHKSNLYLSDFSITQTTKKSKSFPPLVYVKFLQNSRAVPSQPPPSGPAVDSSVKAW